MGFRHRWREWSLMLLLLGLHAWIVMGQSDVCKRLKGDTIKLDGSTLKVANGDVQAVLDCVPAGGLVHVELSELALEETIVIDKPLVIISAVGGTVVNCPQDTTKGAFSLRADNITLQALTIRGCKMSSIRGPIHLENATGVLLEDTEFIKNFNDKGPGCISGTKSSVTMKNSTALQNNGFSGGVLAVSSESVVKIQDSLLRENIALLRGGACNIQNSDLDIDNTAFIENTAAEMGSAVSIEDDFSFKVMVVNSTFTNNRVSGEYNSSSEIKGGGALSLLGSEKVVIQDAIFLNNSAKYGGGGLSGINVTVINILRCTFVNNSAYSGAAAHLENFIPNTLDISVTDTMVEGNTAEGTYLDIVPQGGGFAFYGITSVTMMGLKFHQNYAESFGGAVLLMGGKRSKVQILETNFSKNNVAKLSRNISEVHAGGALFVLNVEKTLLKDCFFINNSGQKGGGLYHAVPDNRTSHLNVNNCMFQLNSVAGEHNQTFGGALGFEGNKSKVRITNSSFDSNAARAYGGAIGGARPMNLDIIDSFFSKDTAGIAGGAIYTEGLNSSSIGIYNTRFDVNHVDAALNEGEGFAGGAVFLQDIPSVIVRSSQFTGCSAPKGGALTMEANSYTEATLEIGDCMFEENHASGQKYSHGGGAVSLSGESLEASINHTKFKENAAAKGGGALHGMDIADVHAVNVSFESNKADQNGGSCYFNDIISTSFTDSSFELSWAGSSGGGIYIAKQYSIDGAITIVDLNNVSFISNTAFEGGAMSAFGGAKVNISKNMFDSNLAFKEGGALQLLNTFIDPGGARMMVNVVMSKFQHNRAGNGTLYEDNPSFLRQGGALSLKGRLTEATIHGVSFKDNEADIGGALSLKGSWEVRILVSRFIRNSALRGGAIAVTRPENPMFIADSEFRRNSAREGGAMVLSQATVLSVDDLKEMKENILNDVLDNFVGAPLEAEKTALRAEIGILRSNFTRNQALLSGGALDVGGLSLLCSKCLFSENIAQGQTIRTQEKGGALWIRSSAVVLLEYTKISSCTAYLGGGAFVEDSVLLSKNSSWISNTAIDAGGAIYGVFGVDFSMEDSLIMQVQDSTIERNRVDRGGVIYITFNEQSFLECSGTKSPDGPFSEEQSTYIDCSNDRRIALSPTNRYALLNRTRLSDNQILGGGPIIFASDTTGIEICCGTGTVCRRGEDLRRLQCTDLINEAEDVATVGTSMQEIQISQTESLGHASGKEMDPIQIVLQDAFGKPASVRATLIVDIKANGVELSGPPVTGISINGTATINGLVLTALPGVYNLAFSVTVSDAGKDIHMIEKSLPVTVRNCTLGEVLRDNGRRCEACEENSYSFDPNFGDCTPCPDHGGHCNGSVLVPEDGFWHFTSQSEFVIKCLHRKACTFKDRIENLKLQSRTSGGKTLTKESEYQQCAKGYEGTLCGSCAPGYGTVRSLECARCTGKASLVLLTVVALLVLIVLSLIFVESGNKYAQEVLATNGSLRTPPSQALPSYNYCPGPSSGGTNSCPSAPLTCKGRVGDIFKILVNFLQVTAIAASINNNWTNIMLRLFSVCGILSGASDTSSFFPFSCGFTGQLRVLQASVLVMLLPFAAWGVFSLYGTIQWMRKKITFHQYAVHCIVSTLAILHVSYTGLMQKAVRIFYCVNAKPSPYRFWAEDTSIECFQHPHTLLVAMAGVPLVLVVGLGFPLHVFMKLYRNRHRLIDRDIVTVYGFFYKSYKDSVAYWEVAIYVRKALLGAIAVFAHLLSVEVQGNLALAVLLVSLILQSHLHPFLDDKLNVIEITSIGTSACAFVIGGLVNSEQGGDMYRIVLSLLLIFIQIGFILYVLAELIHASKEPLKDWLVRHGHSPKSGMFLPLVVEVMQVMFSKIKSVNSAKLMSKLPSLQRKK